MELLIHQQQEKIEKLQELVCRDTDLEQRLEELTERNKTHEELQAEIADKNAHIRVLQQKLDKAASEEEKAELKQQISELKVEIRRLEADNEELCKQRDSDRQECVAADHATASEEYGRICSLNSQLSEQVDARMGWVLPRAHS